MDDEEQASGSGTQRATKAKFPCLRCKKNVAKNSRSIRCSICNFWVHVECEGITNELYNILANPEKYGTSGISWKCDSCQASAAKIHELVEKYENRIKGVEVKLAETESVVQNMDKEVKKIGESLRTRDDKINEKIKRNETGVFEEIRERENRKKNAILYRVDEHDREDATGSERREWDRKLCISILNTLRMGMEDTDIKFVRRLGEKTREARPLCVGFFSEADRDKLLRRGRDLENTRFKDVSICPDLTWRQREEEVEMRKEADRRNEMDLTEDDVSKNLIWAVVGARGQKRLVKTTAREQSTNEYQGQRWRGGPGRPRGTTRVSTQPRGGARAALPPPSHRQQEADRRGQRRRRSSDSEGEEERAGPPPPGKK